MEKENEDYNLLKIQTTDTLENKKGYLNLKQKS